MSELDTVIAVAAAWSAWQDEGDFPFTPDHCINGTKVATRALHHLGVQSRPLSVSFILFNQFAWELWESGVPHYEWPTHAWSIGIHPERPTKGGTGWDGHLMCEGRQWTLDISHRQLHRPGRIAAPEPLVLDCNLPAHGEWVFTDAHHQRLLIGRWARNITWRDAPGWRRRHRDEVDELVQRTTALLATEREHTHD